MPCHSATSTEGLILPYDNCPRSSWNEKINKTHKTIPSQVHFNPFETPATHESAGFHFEGDEASQYHVGRKSF